MLQAVFTRHQNISAHDVSEKKIEMLFAHLKRIFKLDKLRLRGPSGARDEFLLAVTAQNLRRMAKWLTSAAQEAKMIGI
jgi:hypothetical protein